MSLVKVSDAVRFENLFSTKKDLFTVCTFR